MAVELSTHLSPAPNPPPPRTTWRQRIVSHLKPHISAFRQGGGIAMAMTGLSDVRAGLFADRSPPGAESAANAALVVGIAQICGGMKLAYPPVVEGSSVAGTVAGAAGGFWSSLYLLEKIFPKIDQLAYAARVTIGVTIQTGASLVFGGVTSVITTALAKKTVDLYYDYREARARRDNPEANRPLITDSEQPEVLLDPEPAQPATS